MCVSVCTHVYTCMCVCACLCMHVYMYERVQMHRSTHLDPLVEVVADTDGLVFREKRVEDHVQVKLPRPLWDMVQEEGKQ